MTKSCDYSENVPVKNNILTHFFLNFIWILLTYNNNNLTFIQSYDIGIIPKVKIYNTMIADRGTSSMGAYSFSSLFILDVAT